VSSTTPTTPLVWIGDPACQDQAIGLEALPDRFQAELRQDAASQTPRAPDPSLGQDPA
jgi:hypothetical protein